MIKFSLAKPQSTFKKPQGNIFKIEHSMKGIHNHNRPFFERSSNNYFSKLVIEYL